MKTRVSALALVCLLGFGAFDPGLVGAACDGNTGQQVVDALLVRPPMVVVSLVGTGLYVGTSPLTWLMDVDEEAADVLFRWPWWFTSGRCLGHFGQTVCEASSIQQQCDKGVFCCQGS